MRPKSLPVCFQPVQPRFRSPFQLHSSGTSAADLASRLPASVLANKPSSAQLAKPLPAFLPVQPARPPPLKGAPLPRPLPKQASFYAMYPCASTASGNLLPSCPAKAASSSLMKPLADNLVSPVRDLQPPLLKSSAGFVSSRQVHQERSSAVLSLFLQLCTILQPLSRVLSGLQGSLHEVEFQARLLRKVADTTAARYLRSALLFLQTVEDLGGSVLSLSDALAADAIFILHRAGEGCLGHPSNVLKAIRWVTKTLDPVPWPNLWSSLFGIFAGSGASERKESIPLPCGFLAWLERSILGGELNEYFVCFAGAVLLCCNCSLRFGDSQHVDWSSIVVDAQVLRGVSWRTTTSRSGCPFGCLCAGFYGGNDLSQTWVGRYLSCLNTLWHRVRAFAPNSTPDCLFFGLSNDSFAPLSYAATLKSLRTLLVTWGGCSDATAYTLHSMKSTFLSWMAQVGVPEELRAPRGTTGSRLRSCTLEMTFSPSSVPRNFGGRLLEKVLARLFRSIGVVSVRFRSLQFPLRLASFPLVFCNSTCSTGIKMLSS